MARPATYQLDDEKPVTLSLRVPRDLAEQAKAYAGQHRMTLTELLLDGLRLMLETPSDPRELLASDDRNTVMQEFMETVDTKLAVVVGAVDTRLEEVVATLRAEIVAVATDTVQAARHDIPSDSNTVIQELQEMIRTAVEAEVGMLRDFLRPHDSTPGVLPPPEAPAPAPVPELSYGNNTVIQNRSAQAKGRPRGIVRQSILALLSVHTEGLTAEQIRGYLAPERPIGDVLQGMRRQRVVRTQGSGKDMRYFVA